MSLQRLTSLSGPAMTALRTTAASKATATTTASGLRTLSSLHAITSRNQLTPTTTARLLSCTSAAFQNSSNRPGMTPPSPSRSTSNQNSTTATNKDTKLDPDKIKGPGGLTMTQIGRLVQQSRARDLEHQRSKAGSTGSNSSSNSSTGTKRK